MKDYRNKNWRLYFLIVSFLIGFGAIIARLGIVQIKDSWKYKNIAKRQYESKITLKPERGNIYDRNMNTLVSNSIYYSFGVDPEASEDNAGIINLFSEIFNKPKEYYKSKLNKNTRFVWLERMVPENIANQISNRKYEGLIKIEEPRRIYINNEICGQVLGCTNIDNAGLSGIELQFEKILHGDEGFIILQRDGKGKVVPSLDLPKQNPTNGANIVLTIDQIYQTIVDEELCKSAIELEADAATAVMIEPKTGAILALANYPAIDPNKFEKAEPGQNRIRAISDMFEPGSTFKIVTSAALLEEGILKPTDKVFCENGKYTIFGEDIQDTHPHGTISLAEAIEMSSNIFMAKSVKSIGDEKFYKYARNFGFGINTGIELPGEMKGELKRPVDWDQRTIYSLSYGYGLSATVLQLAAAYSAIANGGVLMKPYLVEKIVNDEKVIYQGKPQEIRRVVSQKTAETMTDMFQLVVEKGTGVQAKIDGVNIAGKTGTASKVIEGKYSKKNYAASFVGYVPAKHPKFVIMILMDSPKKSFYGGEASAPVFKRIVSRIMSFENLKDDNEPKNESKDEKLYVRVPNLKQQKTEVAGNILKQLELEAVIIGNGEKIVKQMPEPNQKVMAGEKIKLFTSSDSAKVFRSNHTMPDIKGLSIRDAIARLSNSYLNISVSGSGAVVQQEPEPGEKISKGKKCRLICEPVRI
jgi:cell division protein FtsI/penicillin-binding protein 2